MYILSQAFAFIALCSTASSYFYMEKKLLFCFQTIGNFALIISFACLGELFATIGTAIATIRTGIFSVFAFRKKETPWWVVFLIVAATLVSVIISYSTPFDIMYFVGLSLFTCSLKFKTLCRIKTGILVANVIYIVYDFVLRNYTSAVVHGLESVSIIVSVIVMKKSSGKETDDEKEQ